MVLQNQVLELLKSPTTLQEMSHSAKAIAVVDSAEQLAELVRQIFSSNHTQTKSSEKREIFH
jgi:UDP-N-acetylglucosamine--N-acetylmuramyl-(pentapeptide) pyrophosphoryl-undecaprenol N-acetylglucosamine transferase